VSDDRAATLRALGEANRRKNPAAARAAYEEAVALLRGGDDPLLFAHTVRHLGDVCREQGDNAAAAPCYDEALAVYRANAASARRLDVANAVRSAAILKHETGQLDDARALWAEALELYRAENIEPGVAESTRRLAMLARQQ
jgi:tetratricopeptide (TPR) repeat protein